MTQMGTMGGPAGPGWWQASDGNWYPPHQQPGMPVTGVPYMAAAGTNGLAVASLVLSLLWLFWIGSLLAVIFGFIAMSQINKSGGRQGGRGLAIAGTILGGIGLLTLAGGAVVAATADPTPSYEPFDSYDYDDEGIDPYDYDDEGINSDPYDGWCNEDRYMQDPDC